jgi:hypothetical protein
MGGEKRGRTYCRKSTAERLRLERRLANSEGIILGLDGYAWGGCKMVLPAVAAEGRVIIVVVRSRKGKRRHVRRGAHYRPLRSSQRKRGYRKPEERQGGQEEMMQVNTAKQLKSPLHSLPLQYTTLN